MITLNDAITASGKYNDRLTNPECTDEVKTNLNELLIKVNSLLDELDLKDIRVSSGFRPSEVNAALANSAKKSHHVTGNAIDLLDNGGKLDELFSENIPMLEKHGLYLESPKSTIGWSHLQDIPTHSNPFLP